MPKSESSKNVKGTPADQIKVLKEAVKENAAVLAQTRDLIAQTEAKTKQSKEKIRRRS